MSEFKVQPKSIRAYVNCLSGLFISKNNPQGLTPSECAVLSALLYKLPNNEPISKEVKIEVANMTNNKVQVLTNYITKFTKKGVVINKKLHPVFYKQQITIQYGA